LWAGEELAGEEGFERSGQPRVAIVGYYEEGANLIRLAMNGWAEAEPAW
jgi:hypothetical protein